MQIASRFVLSLGLAGASALSFFIHHKHPTPAARVPTHMRGEKPNVKLAPAPPTPPRTTDISTAAAENSSLTVPPSLGAKRKREKAAPAAAQPNPIRKHAYFYNDGEFVGAPVDVEYGLVQVSATIRDGWITDIKWLQDPEDIDLSRQINHDAMPRLTREAVKAQNAEVDMISGASFTVLGFRASLGTALAQASKSGTAP